MANLADLVVRVTSDVKGVQVGLAKTRADLQKTQAEAEQTGRAFKTSSAVIAAGATAIAAGIGAYALKSRQTFASWGKELRGVQRLTGATAEQAGKLYAEMKLTSGMTVDTGTALAFLAKNLGAAHSGSGPLYEDLQRLGISMKDASGEWRTGADILPELRDRLAELKDPSDRAKIAADALGRGYKTLLPYLTASADAMRENQRFLRDLGFRVTDKDMAAFAKLMGDEKKFAFAQQYMQFQMGRLVADLENKVMPALIKVATLFNKLPKEVILAVGALAGFIGIVKGAQAVLDIFNGARGLLGMGGAFAANVGKTAADTAAVAANTAAVEANTIARQQNAAVGAIGTGVSGTGVGTAAAGSAGLGVAGTLAVAAVPVAIVASTLLLTKDLNRQKGMDPRGIDPETGKPVNVGTRRRGRGGTNDPGFKSLAESNLETRAALRDSILASHSSTTAVSKAESAVKDVTAASKDLTQAVQDNTATIKESILSESQSVFEAMSRASAQGLTLSSTELDKFMTEHPLTAAPVPNADNQPLATTGVKYHEFARGGSGVTSGPMLALIGEAGPEPYAIGKDHVGRGSVVFKDCTFSARSPRELMELMKRELSREVRYANG